MFHMLSTQCIAHNWKPVNVNWIWSTRTNLILRWMIRVNRLLENISDPLGIFKAFLLQFMIIYTLFLVVWLVVAFLIITLKVVTGDFHLVWYSSLTTSWWTFLQLIFWFSCSFPSWIHAGSLIRPFYAFLKTKRFLTNFLLKLLLKYARLLLWVVFLALDHYSGVLLSGVCRLQLNKYLVGIYYVPDTVQRLGVQ